MLVPSEIDHNCFRLPAVLGVMVVSALLNPLRVGPYKYVDQSPGPAAFAGLCVFNMPAMSEEPKIMTINMRVRPMVRRFLSIPVSTFLFIARSLFAGSVRRQARPAALQEQRGSYSCEM